jgi:hypothetical protein
MPELSLSTFSLALSSKELATAGEIMFDSGERNSSCNVCQGADCLNDPQFLEPLNYAAYEPEDKRANR